jgi:hypothetical protein
MYRENFTQLLIPGQTLTNRDNDTNNNFLVAHTGTTYTSVLYSYMGMGNTSDTFNITLDGTTFDISAGNIITGPINSITLNHYVLMNTGGTYNVVNDTTVALATNPGLLISGYAIRKSYF